jgi:hypothetical protein
LKHILSYEAVRDIEAVDSTPATDMKIPSVPNLAFRAILASACLFLETASAQVLFSAGPYNQNFDSLANSGTANTWTDNSTLPGWYASKTVAGAVTTYRADNGAGNAGAIYSFGATGSSERALGSIASGTPGNFAYGVRFLNDTVQAVTNLSISYVGEQWRNGGGRICRLAVIFSSIGDNRPDFVRGPSGAADE